MNNSRRSRVQGGWAAPSPNRRGIRSDMNKVKPPAVPIWLGKNIDQSNHLRSVPSTMSTNRTNSNSENEACSSYSKLQYIQPSQEELQQKPPDIIINKGGVYDISKSNNGLSRLRFFPDFIEKNVADKYFEELFDGLPWHKITSFKNRETIVEPRLITWIGDLPYTYSGIAHNPDSNWRPPLPVIREKVEDLLGYKFNSALCNLYRDDKDGVGWHSDDEPELGPQPVIASLSFGDTRNFELRKKPVPNDGDYSLSQVVKVPLTSGSLIVMEGVTQDDWQHRIPKEYHDRGPRINLTMRVIYPAK